MLGILLFIELAGQIIHLVAWKRFLFYDPDKKVRELIFRKHPYLSVALNKNITAIFDKEKQKIVTTALGTRWTGADIEDTNKIRIACLGGSTTFCTGVADEDSWPAILQKKLGSRYAVINYGVPGYSTVESLIQMCLFIPEIKPKMIFFYEGWNDLHNYFTAESVPDYYHHGQMMLQNVKLGRKEEETCFEKFRRQSGFFYFIDNIKERIIKRVPDSRYTVHDPAIDHLFSRNLQSMIVLAEARHAQPVIISQVLNPFTERKENFSRPWTVHIEDTSVPALMTHINGIAKKTCEATGQCIFLDYENQITWTEKNFIDEVHFSKRGNEKFASALCSFIKTRDH